MSGMCRVVSIGAEDGVCLDPALRRDGCCLPLDEWMFFTAYKQKSRFSAAFGWFGVKRLTF